jgi:hypothetical protein
LSTGVSMMMNGVCCVYQMNGERELRQAMRNDIREEWREQRELEARTRLEQDQETERLRLQALERRHELLYSMDRRRQPQSSSRKTIDRFSTYPSEMRGRWSGVSERYSPTASIPSLLDEEVEEEPTLAEELQNTRGYFMRL